MGWDHLKIFFSRTAGPILTRLGTDHSYLEGIQVCSNEGDNPSPRGNNSNRMKIHWKFFKIFFSRTSRPNSTKLGKNYPWVKGIQVCSNEGSGPLQRRVNHKNEKMGRGHLKILFWRTMKPEKLNFTWKLSDMEQRQVVYIMGPQGRMGQIKMKCILYFYMDQGYSGERCGPWDSFFIRLSKDGTYYVMALFVCLSVRASVRGHL
jgi:hypothetical protein